MASNEVTVDSFASTGLDYRDFKLNYVSPIKRANTLMSTLFKDLGQKEKVRIDLYYEVFYSGCIYFNQNEFGPLVESMGDYLDIHTYPYGFARTIEEKGNIFFKCHHGPLECYGNKLHACALDNLEHSKAILFNICLMNSTESLGSDDKTADECGKNMNVDSKPIKLCAKGNRGSELMKYYGEETKKAKIEYVSFALINGEKYDYRDDFKRSVCRPFKNLPPPCEEP
ncbi:legumaturain [Danaus plexippus plexippus]|uniref:Legumaturain n=1 Tax=Danaus plexippus plexippus TaxID=278856 RepID=A0A212FBC5_DANPL|nr:legumaturain [Danaus plexippus plexippus]